MKIIDKTNIFTWNMNIFIDQNKIKICVIRKDGKIDYEHD